VPPSQLWEALSRTHRYRTWWPWLRRLDGSGLQPGTTTDCEVRAPLPYSLRFRVQIVEVVPLERIATVVSGDIAGPARLEMAAHPSGASVRLAWTVELRDPVLRPAAVVGRPVMQWAHDRVVASGVEQFRRRALDVSGATT